MASTKQANEPPEKRRYQEKKDLMSILEEVIDVPAEDTTSYEEEEAKEIQKYMLMQLQISP